MTRAVILAAGEGTRLRPLTDRLPKALVPLAGTPMIERQLRVLHAAGIADVSLVVGFHAETLAAVGTRRFHNPRYAQTNMVASLHRAKALFDGGADVVIAYGDIVYEAHVLQTLLDTPGPLAVVVDLGWHSLWQFRMDDPLADAETMKLDAAGCIVELGRRPKSLADIEGQYIGLLKVGREFAPQFFARYEGWPVDVPFEGKPVERMYMTSYVQHQIDHGVPVRAAKVTHGWLEVDSVQDLQRYEQAQAQGRLAPLCRLGS